MTLELSWDVADRSRWEELFFKLPRSNLLQSWAYGEARARYSGMTVRRAMILDDNRPVGLVQGYERRVARVPVGLRINRGPLFLATPDTAGLESVYRSLARATRFWEPLVISPELEAADAHRSVLRRLGFHKLPSPCWRSAFVDLNKPMDEIRAALNRKWRNHLARAERNSLDITIAQGADALHWMLERYQQSMTERSYTGIPIPILAKLWADGKRAADGMVVRVDGQGSSLAAMLFARHGTTATYLAGWIGDQGRQTRAGYLTLWVAMEELKRRDCRWLDLGGISEAETPGVAQFKNGLGGHGYELVGTYIHR